MTVHEVLLTAQKQFQAVGIDSHWLDAEILLAHVLGQTREHLITHSDTQLNNVTIQQFNHLIIRRARKEPVAYITGEKEFYGLKFKVTPDVLIPRPATEELVETAINNFRLSTFDFRLIVDIGTGSGCIAITLAKQIPNAHIYATDISEKALAIARENAKTHNVLDRITFLQGNLLDPVIPSLRRRGQGRFLFIIITNLPYVPTNIIDSKPELASEPRLALDGGPDGTLIYRQLLKQLTEFRYLCHGEPVEPSLIALEIEPEILNPLLASPELLHLKKHYSISHTPHTFILTRYRN